MTPGTLICPGCRRRWHSAAIAGTLLLQCPRCRRPGGTPQPALLRHLVNEITRPRRRRRPRPQLQIDDQLPLESAR
jgi:hypothetical protein